MVSSTHAPCRVVVPPLTCATFDELIDMVRGAMSIEAVRARFGRDSVLFDSDVEVEESSAHHASVELPACGIELSLHRDVSTTGSFAVRAAFLHGGGYQGYEAFGEALPLGVAFGVTYDDLMRRAPAETGGGVGYSELLSRPYPRWMRYRLADVVMHLEFDVDDELSLVTLMRDDDPALPSRAPSPS